MLALTAAQILALPVDELALRVVTDFQSTGGWNEHNYMLESHQHAQLTGEALSALAEAMGWARAHGLVARHPTQGSADSIFVTREGSRVVREGLATLRAEVRLSSGLHEQIEGRARRQFLLGELEQAVFVSMKAVEVRVRRLSRLSEDDYGVDLMNRAFGPSGPLSDPTAAKGEREGVRSLFAGAYAVLRNPSGHLDVDYDDVAEAAEAVVVASLLMRILDRVEDRVS